MSLKNKTINGIKWTTLSMVITALLQFLQLALLTKFLNPSAFGLMSLVMVFVGFSQLFLDMGISNAIIHKQEINKNQLSSLYWLNILVGFLLFSIIAIIAPSVSHFYKEPQLKNLIWIVATTFIIQPFGQQFMTIWQKQMRFFEIAKIEITNKFIALVVSTYLAYLGYGVYSLAFGILSGVVCQTLLLLYIGLKDYCPSFVFNFRDIKEFLSFGTFQIAEKSINYLSAQIDTIMIGKLLGAESLGLYTVIKQLMEKTVLVINGILNKVNLPLFAKIQEDDIRIKNTFLKVLLILTFIQFPLLTTLYFYGYDIILFVIGNKWFGIDNIIKLFVFYSLFVVYGNPIGSLILAKGKANWSFYSNFISFIFNLLFMFIFITKFGLNGALYSFIFVQIISLYPYWKFLVSKLITIGFFEYYSTFFRQIIISFGSGYVCYLFSKFISNKLWLNLTSYFISMLTLFLLLNYALNKSIYSELKQIREKN